jgi:hypothetical protein
VVLVLLVIQGFFLYRWYDRYYGYNAASFGETTQASFGSTEETAAQKTLEDTGPQKKPPQHAAIANAGATTFGHTATDANSRGDYTYLSHPGIDGDPDAVVLVAMSQNRRSPKAAAYDHNIGVWYEGADRKKWAIFNQDRAAVPAGATFEVIVPPASRSFVHHAGPANTYGNTTYLNNPLTNGHPDAILLVTQNWNPGGGVGVYNDHSVGVLYNEDAKKWALYNQDGAPIPDGAAFNIGVGHL